MCGKKANFKSGRSPHKLSIWDKPVENPVLALMPALPVRNKAGGIIEIQPQSFRNTQDPDILRREVFPNRQEEHPPVLDSWLNSGWQNPQGPDRNRYGCSTCAVTSLTGLSTHNSVYQTGSWEDGQGCTLPPQLRTVVKEAEGALALRLAHQR